MVLYLYSASVGEKEFSFNMDLNVASQATIDADLKLTLDEVSDSILKNLRESGVVPSESNVTGEDTQGEEKGKLMCFSCHKAPTTRLVHHLLFFDHAHPPRVEDLPTPVCPSLDCERLCNGRHWMELEAAISLDPQMRQKFERGLPGCFFCREKVRKQTGASSAGYNHASDSSMGGADGERTEQANTVVSAAAAPPLLRCSRCHIARYCSVACQQSDWPIHKQLCGGNFSAS